MQKGLDKIFTRGITKAIAVLPMANASYIIGWFNVSTSRYIVIISPKKCWQGIYVQMMDVLDHRQAPLNKKNIYTEIVEVRSRDQPLNRNALERKRKLWFFLVQKSTPYPRKLLSQHR